MTFNFTDKGKIHSKENLYASKIFNVQILSVVLETANLFKGCEGNNPLESMNEISNQIFALIKFSHRSE